MKSILKLTISLLFISMTVHGQFKYTGESIVIGDEVYTPIVLNNKWGIDYWENGLNFWIPYPNTNFGNYKLFLQDNGYIGIGKKPAYKLDVAGDVATAGVFRTTSDIRLKTNIQDLAGCLNKVIKLNGKSYIKNNPPLTNSSQTLDETQLGSIKYNTSILNPSQNESSTKTQFGFIAQELQEVFPELVSTDNAGYLSIDYTGLIPVIIEAIKEQEKDINRQEDDINKLLEVLNHLENKTSSNLSEETSSMDIYKEYIKYQLASNVRSATVYVYTITGTLLTSYPLPINKVQGNIDISKSDLPSGIYYYTLVCDGSVAVSKKMNK